MKRFASVILVTAALAAACNDVRQPARVEWMGTRESLPGGGVRVINPATPLWDTANAWQLHEEYRIGRVQGEGPDIFGQIMDIEVDSTGRIFILESQAQEIRVFSSNGIHERTFGRSGSGPGEMRSPAGIRIMPDGHLLVVDPGNARYTIVDGSGNYVSDSPRSVQGQYWPWPGELDDAGRIYERISVRDSTQVRHAIIRLAEQTSDTFPIPLEQGQRIDWRTPDGIFSARLPFGADFVSFLDARRSAYWFGRGDTYRIYRTSLSGDTTLVIERTFEALQVTDRERDSVVASLQWLRDAGGKVESSDIPRIKPAFSSFHIDADGNLWVRAVTANHPGFDVFDADGRYLGHVPLPLDLKESPDPQIVNDVIYAVAETEVGVPFVVKLRIQRGSGAT